MPHIPRHSFDRAHAQSILGTYRKRRELVLKMLPQDSSRLAPLVEIGRVLGYLVAALGPVDEECLAALRLGAQAGAALFALGRSEGKALRLPVGDRVVELAHHADGSSLHGGKWNEAYTLATLTGDTASLALLAAVPIELLRRSSSRGPEYAYLMAEAERSSLLRDGREEEWLLAALRAADPDQVDDEAAEIILNMQTPTMEVWFALLDGDRAALDAALEKKLRLHARFFDTAALRSEPEGFLSGDALALMVRARLAGLSPGVTSDYAPAAIVDAGAAARAQLLLCPYCLTPIVADAVCCPGCLLDPRDDAPFEMDDRDLAAAPRKPCRACATHLLGVAIMCPSCRTRQ